MPTSNPFRQYLGVPVDAGWLMQFDFPDEWVIEDLLEPGGRMIVAGQAKLGKSLVTTQAAICVGSGLDWIGFRTTQTATVLTNFEDGPRMLGRRLRDMSSEYPMGFKNLLIQSKPRDLESAMDAVLDLPEPPGLWVMDPMIYLGYEDENSSAKVMERLNVLNEFIDKYNTAVILVHHSGKESRKPGEGYEGLMRFRGSTAITAWLDTGIVMVKEDDTTFHMGITTKVGPAQPNITLHRDPNTLVYYRMGEGDSLMVFIREYHKCRDILTEATGMDASVKDVMGLMSTRRKVSIRTLYRQAERLGVDLKDIHKEGIDT